MCPKSLRSGCWPSSFHLTCAGRPAAKTVVEIGFVGYKEARAILATRGRTKTQEQKRLQSRRVKRVAIVSAGKLQA